MTQRRSRFAAIFDAAQDEEAPAEAPADTRTVRAVGHAERPAAPTPAPAAPLTPQPASARNLGGRPATGKRSDPNFAQTSIYIPKDLHRAVKVQLLNAGDQDLSDLIAELMQRWLDEQKRQSR